MKLNSQTLLYPTPPSTTFSVHEDRASGELIVEMPRFMPDGDTYMYRLEE